MKISVDVYRRTPGHSYIRIWVNGALTGEVCTRLDEEKEFLECLSTPRLSDGALHACREKLLSHNPSLPFGLLQTAIQEVREAIEARRIWRRDYADSRV